MKITPPAIKPEKLIEFKKENCQVVEIKKQDRLLISGPCEIIFSEFQVDPSLDYKVKIILSMPRDNKMVKIQPRGVGDQIEQQGIKEQNKTNILDQ